MRVLFGLGNPGSEYERTRHNAGFWFIDRLAEAAGARWLGESKMHAMVARLPGHVLLVKPTTFMNRSGLCVSAVLNYYKLPSESALIAHDELDLPVGVARLKFDGGHGGQNGLRDIQTQLGHGRFGRLRLGIGHPGDKTLVTPWVLGRPSVAQEQAIREAIDAALAVVDTLTAGHWDRAMQQLHQPAKPGPR